MAAIFLSIIVILLSSIDIGYLFYMKRDLQKTADLAALAGAQKLAGMQLFASTNTTCAASDDPVLAAIGNAQANGFSTLAPNSMSNAITVTCGRWDPVLNLSSAPNYFSTPTAGISLNAVQVVVSQTVPAFFGLGAHTISGRAIASISDPYAAFSVGSKLLQVNSSGLVPGLLSALGLNLNGTSLVSYNGLANVSVTPNGLLQALGFQIPLHADIGTVTQILQANTSGCSNGMCTLQALLGAITTVGGQQDLVSALGGLTVGQLNVMVPLLSDPNTGQGGLFTLINAADAQSALNVNLNALNVLNTAIGVANSHRFGTIDLGLTLPGIASVTTMAGIVEPPSIGIGGVNTTAFTAQVRLYIRIQSNLLNLGLIMVDLPIIIDVVNGFGQITKMCAVGDRDPSGNDTATIAVQAPILSLCAGSINGAVDGATVFSTNGACKQNLQNWPMVNVLGGALMVNKAISVDALPNTSPPLTLIKGQTSTTANNNLQIGTTVTNFATALINSLNSALLGNLLNLVLAPVVPVLTVLFQSILNGLGDAVASLLNSLLGIQLGLVDVSLLDLNCGSTNIKLVY